MTDIATAIKAINNDAEFVCYNENINDIKWGSGTTPISKTDIENKIAELKEAETDKETKRASAKQKLQDLGLTVDEIKEAFGI